MRFVGAELLCADDAGPGEGGVGGHVCEEGGVAVGEGGGEETLVVEGGDAAGGVGPRG